MQAYENVTQPKFQSQIEIINLHATLNNELEKFHKCIREIRKHTHLDVEHLENEKAHIMQTIYFINEKIKSMTSTKKN